MEDSNTTNLVLENNFALKCIHAVAEWLFQQGGRFIMSPDDKNILLHATHLFLMHTKRVGLKISAGFIRMALSMIGNYNFLLRNDERTPEYEFFDKQLGFQILKLGKPNQSISKSAQRWRRMLETAVSHSIPPLWNLEDLEKIPGEDLEIQRFSTYLRDKMAELGKSIPEEAQNSSIAEVAQSVLDLCQEMPLEAVPMIHNLETVLQAGLTIQQIKKIVDDT